MALHQGKKILIVNIASGSEYAAVQLPQLQQLHQLYKDSLSIVAFPSNDFGHEPLTDAELKLLLQETYQTSFDVSIKSGVKDSTATTHAVYQWLQRPNENGAMAIKVKNDFQKYLIDKTGSIIGVFGPKTKPLDAALIAAITQ
jgi:glutathione peroxidase